MNSLTLGGVRGDEAGLPPALISYSIQVQFQV